ncbi:MAG TPA: polysialyltransferase family glycosyltransferase [Buttiauxella sp.]|jgi:hypothetical protein
MDKLKIYLSSGSVPIIPQMLDFSACAEDPHIAKIICWYRNELTPLQLKGTNACYIRQKYKVSPDFVLNIINIINKFKPYMVEIHSNIVFTNVELYPIIAVITKYIKREKIKIHLYDDGIRSINDRYQLDGENEDDFVKASEICTDYLDTLLNNDENPFSSHLHHSWPLLMNYVWHNHFDTTYHLMGQYKNKLNTSSSFQKYIQQSIQELNSVDLKSTSLKNINTCLSLLNLKNQDLAEIKEAMGQDNSLLYMGAGFYDKAKDDRVTERQVNKIKSMKDNGIITNNDKIIFKAHPINHHENRKKIVDAFGCEVYTIPNHIPFEILPCLGLEPEEIICSFSTLLFTMKPDIFRHVIGNADTTTESLTDPLLNLLIKENVIKQEIISGWLN